MSLWIAWWEAIRLLRPAFSRLRSFMWFATAVAGLTVRTELLGVTSIVRALKLTQLSQLAPEIACFSEGAAREGAWIRGVRLESGCSGDRVSSQAARFAYNA
jgi:hypothetical protein